MRSDDWKYDIQDVPSYGLPKLPEAFHNGGRQIFVVYAISIKVTDISMDLLRSILSQNEQTIRQALVAGLEACG